MSLEESYRALGLKPNPTSSAPKLCLPPRRPFREPGQMARAHGDWDHPDARPKRHATGAVPAFHRTPQNGAKTLPGISGNRRLSMS
jgi:hypothetical protein